MEKDLGKPKLERTETYTTPSGLDVSVRSYQGEPLNGVFTIVEPPPKITIAYDVAGNAIEVDLQDIIDKKLRPTPDFRPATEEEIKTIEVKQESEPKKTRSGKTYDC
jgi:hypothetical protein